MSIFFCFLFFLDVATVYSFNKESEIGLDLITLAIRFVWEVVSELLNVEESDVAGILSISTESLSEIPCAFDVAKSIVKKYKKQNLPIVYFRRYLYF